MRQHPSARRWALHPVYLVCHVVGVQAFRILQAGTAITFTKFLEVLRDKCLIEHPNSCAKRLCQTELRDSSRLNVLIQAQSPYFSFCFWVRRLVRRRYL